jgi:hypothetical protein
MSPEGLAAIVQLVLFAWLALLAANILYGLLSGRINTDRILSHDEDRDASADRVVLLLTTLGFALYYVITSLRAPLDPTNPSLPEISTDMLVALLGVNGVYLSSKYMQTPKRRS